MITQDVDAPTSDTSTSHTLYLSANLMPENFAFTFFPTINYLAVGRCYRLVLTATLSLSAPY